MTELGTVRHFALLAIVVLDPKGKPRLTLLQRKDDGHPNPSYHWRLTLFGGGSKEKRAWREILEERLSQQFGATVLIQSLINAAVPTEVMERSMQDSSGDLVMNLLVATLDFNTFSMLRDRLLLPREGQAVPLEIHEVRWLMGDRAYFLPDIPGLLQEALPDLFA